MSKDSAPELESSSSTASQGRTPLRGVRGPNRLVSRLAVQSWGRWRRSTPLRRSFNFWAGLGALLTVGSGVSAGWLGGDPALGAWLGVSWWLLTTAFLFVALDMARIFPTNEPVERLGIPNGLTAVRAYMALPILFYAILPPQFLARDLFLCVASPVALLDAADGWVARRFGPVTVLGRALDPIMDTTFFSLSALGCLLLGFVPLWLALLVLARYGIPALAFLVLYPWLPRRPAMVATRFGKVNTFASGICLAGSSLLVLAGGPTLIFDLIMGTILAATAVGQILTLARRGLEELRSRG